MEFSQFMAVVESEKKGETDIELWRRENVKMRYKKVSATIKHLSRREENCVPIFKNIIVRQSPFPRYSFEINEQENVMKQ